MTTSKTAYPTEKQLQAMGATLERDVCLWSAGLAAWCGRVGTSAVQRAPSPAPKRIVAWPRRRGGKRIA